MSVSANNSSRDYRWLVVLVVALAVRGGHLLGDVRSPFFDFRGIDALDYHQMAQGMQTGAWPDGQPFFWAPLYPLVLGVLYALVGQGALTLKLLQIVLGSASCVLVYRIGLRLLHEPRAALAAGLVAALYGPFVHFDSQLLSACLDVFLQLLAIYLLLSAGADPQRSGRWLAAGMVIGLSVVNRGAILLLMPWVVVWMIGVLRFGWLVGGHTQSAPLKWRTIAVHIARVVAPTVVTLGLAVLHNVRADGEASRGDMGLLPVASNLGVNFYLGNHWNLRDINKTGHPQHFSRYDEITALPEEAGITGAFAQSHYLVRQTLHDIAAKPKAWLRLMIAKTGQLLAGGEIPRSGNLYAARGYSPVLAALMWKHGIAFPAGVVIPFGLVGMALALGAWRKHFVPLAAVATQGAFVLMFFVTARYRLPAMPLVIIYAVYAIQALLDFWRARRRARAGAVAAVIVSLAVACNWGTTAMDREHGYYEYCLLAQVREQAGDRDQAIAYYRKGLALNPEYAWGHIHLGRALLESGDARAAEEHLRRGIRIEPDSPNVPAARLYLGRALARRRRWEEAVAEWKAALAGRPDFTPAHAELCGALRRMGRDDEAQPHCRAAAESRSREGGRPSANSDRR